jgi:hypothetical protein
MYVSYLLASVVYLSLYFLGQWLWPEFNAYLLILAITIVYLPLVPVVFRYSRVIWMHFERSACPGELSATVYEKVKLREIERQRQQRGH